MNKKFTKLMAALALLTFLAVPMGMWGQTTYEQLTSIANIDESAQYVLGIDGTGFHYSGTSNWGLTALPSAQTPIYYTLTKASDGNSFTAQATISGTTYYLQIPTSNTFSMATSTGTNTDIIIGTTQVSGTNYAVANKSNTNRHLRINGTSGLRSYAGTTGTMAFFYKVVVPSGNTYTVTYHANGGTGDDIVDTYNEGANFTVAANSFSNPGYAFTEWNTEEDGSGENYSPGDEIENIDANIDLYAQWEESNETVDELTRDFTGIPEQNIASYNEWKGKTGISTAVYAGQSAGANNSITLRSNNSNSGIVTTTSGGKVKKVSVIWNSTTSSGRTLDVYGKNTPYSDATDLYGNNNPNQGTSIGSIVKGTSTELTVDGDYTYIGLRSKSGAMYIDKIEITWDNSYSATMTVEAYDVDAETGWYFIASPFSANNSLVATDGNNLPVALDDDATDLYYYDEPTHTWKNYKQHPDDFTFANGVGYLYANSGDVTLTFAGTSLVANEVEGITLSYTEAAAPLAGWNLVGNPFDCNATLDKPCYTISGMAINTEAQTANEYLVGPCKGVLVKATENGETVTFTKVAAGQTPQPNQLQMTVAQQVVTRNGASTGSATVEDNAIVCFNEGNRLEKFAFNADAAKLYIPQNDKEYAIVSAEAQGEMPVNFRATKNGTYTLTINPEGVEMNYLHLIDNMTGANIDLLQTPSYTFNASMNDYESRFKLVFAAGSSTGSEASETFAFFANGELIVSNEGEATLQVVDMTGRILSSQSLNGNGSVQMAAPVGVYVLRLISGNEVKTQKIVVR